MLLVLERWPVSTSFDLHAISISFTLPQIGLAI